MRCVIFVQNKVSILVGYFGWASYQRYQEENPLQLVENIGKLYFSAGFTEILHQLRDNRLFLEDEMRGSKVVRDEGCPRTCLFLFPDKFFSSYDFIIGKLTLF